MSRVNPIRFIMLGAAGFGVGGAAAGTAWPLLLLTGFWAAGLLVVLAGAAGGAALSLALRDRRKAISLVLLGALGFTIGGFVASIAAFVGLVPSSESGALEALGTGAMGVIGGAAGGAALGLAFLDWKRVVTLALAGAAGLAAGAIAGFYSLRAIFGEDFLLGTTGTLSLLIVTGVIGGASLGAALGYLEWAAQRPRGRLLLRLSALGSVMMGGVLFAVFFALPYMSICGSEERAALDEFPQYGGVEVEPKSDPQSYGCYVSYETSAPPERVAAYLSEQLEEQGWTVKSRLEVEGDGSNQFEGTLVRARRDGLAYEAGFESLRFYEPPQPGTHVVVYLWENE